METSTVLRDGHVNGNHPFASSSQRDVSYSCGSCGYELNLNSSNRNTSTIGSKYGKSIKRGIISFFSIDESRFTQVDEFQCVPYFISKYSWGLLRRKTKLLCRKCGNHVGDAHDTSLYPPELDGPDASPSGMFCIIPSHQWTGSQLRSLNAMDAQPRRGRKCSVFSLLDGDVYVFWSKTGTDLKGQKWYKILKGFE
ncbi:uncharacterized protein At4g08330, chloroplastic [Malania oleifera]|uniref:uncharacterized protein At4g08330, chloroplastic n=1 Tax=Malania oleifera TaxID=397392 RepID=UPI0025ADF116|nr:uncharacterized protein At4g08330, chloroplastic [Malania oleifera]